MMTSLKLVVTAKLKPASMNYSKRKNLSIHQEVLWSSAKLKSSKVILSLNTWEVDGKYLWWVQSITLDQMLGKDFTTLA